MSATEPVKHSPCLVLCVILINTSFAGLIGREPQGQLILLDIYGMFLVLERYKK